MMIGAATCVLALATRKRPPRGLAGRKPITWRVLPRRHAAHGPFGTPAPSSGPSRDRLADGMRAPRTSTLLSAHAVGVTSRLTTAATSAPTATRWAAPDAAGARATISSTSTARRLPLVSARESPGHPATEDWI